MQHDSSTYCDEPEDVEAYQQWLSAFDMAAAQPSIDKALAENDFLAELQVRVVVCVLPYTLLHAVPLL
jgi:hypothetical protein